MDLAGYDPARDAGEQFYYDPEAAEKPIVFCERYLRHVKGALAKKPFLLAPWQKDYVRTLFGWRHKETGLRRYRQSYLEVPRKNGKSTLAAFLAIYFLGCDNEFGGENYLAASDRDQASLIFDIVQGMIRFCPALKSRFKPLDSRKRIIYPKTHSFLVAIAADAASAHGYNSHFVCIDELHAQPNRELFDVLQTSTGARTQPFFLSITTAGYDKLSICYQTHEFACKVRDGIIEAPHFLPVVYGAEEADDWTSPATWQKANPNYGVSISAEYLAQECKKAQEQPSYENTFKRLHLNIWTEQETRFIPMAAWNQCRGPLPSFDGKDCWAGLDLSSTTDLTSLVVACPIEDKVYLEAYHWMPEENAREREKQDRVPYRLWAADPRCNLYLTPGNVVDYRYIEQKILELNKRYYIQEVAYDRYNATDIVQRLLGEGVKMLPMGQGFVSFNAPTKEFEKRILEQTICVGENPCLDWQASNVAVKTDPAGNIKPVKPDHKDSKRIDGIVGSIMALSRVIARDRFYNPYNTGQGMTIL